MRILHVVQAIDLKLGGVQEALRGLTHAQCRMNMDVDIVGTSIAAQRDTPAYISGYNQNINLRLYKAEFVNILFSNSMRKYLKREINKYDLVHVHGLYRFPPTYASHRARKQNVPYVITPHGSLDPFLYRRSSRNLLLKRLWERWFDLPNLHGASAIHYTSEDERERAAFLKLRAPSFVVPIGLDWARFASLPARGAFRAQLGIGEAPLVLFLSRLNFKKGLDLLVPAFAKVRACFPDAVLALVGPDNEGYGAKVRGWVAEQGLVDAVRFVDHIEGEQVLQAYVDADVFALPSYTENFGMVVAESLACATPVVISDQVNIHGEVSGAGAGLVTRCDAGEVAEALCVLLADAPRRAALGAAGRELVQRQWTWDVVARQLTTEYERVIERHRNNARSEPGGPR